MQKVLSGFALKSLVLENQDRPRAALTHKLKFCSDIHIFTPFKPENKIIPILNQIFQLKSKARSLASDA